MMFVFGVFGIVVFSLLVLNWLGGGAAPTGPAARPIQVSARELEIMRDIEMQTSKMIEFDVLHRRGVDVWLEQTCALERYIRERYGSTLADEFVDTTIETFEEEHAKLPDPLFPEAIEKFKAMTR